MATAVIACVPSAVLLVPAQRFKAAGVTGGAVKWQRRVAGYSCRCRSPQRRVRARSEGPRWSACRQLRLDARRASRVIRLALTFHLLEIAENTRLELVRACIQHAFQVCWLAFGVGRQRPDQRRRTAAGDLAPVRGSSPPDQQAALPAANLSAVSDELKTGALVSIARGWLRIRLRPVRAVD
jgi:hypothetical protein